MMMKNVVILFCVLVSYFSNAQWSQTGLNINGDSSNDNFGRSVSINSDGTIVAIGGHLNDASGLDAGHVKILQLQGGNWVQLGQDITGSSAGDQAGNSICLNSNGLRVAIASFGNDDNGNASGHVRVFDYDGTNWNQVGANIVGEGINDQSGFAIALSGNGDVLAIGAPLNDDTAPDAGHVRVFTDNQGTWTQLGTDIDGFASGDEFGYSLDINFNGDRIIVGSPFNDAQGSDSGKANIYNFNGTNWIQLGQSINGESINDHCGYSVSISQNGNVIAVGAIHNQGNGADAGHVRVYQYDLGAWVQLGANLEGTNSGNQFGNSISLNEDGTILAASSILSNTNQGKTRVLQYNGTNWLLLGNEIGGESLGDLCGYSVSTNAIGDKVIMGSPWNDNSGSNAGQGRVYEIQLPCSNTYASFSHSECSNYTVPSGDETYSFTGTQMIVDTIANSCGADSILSINLTLGDFTPPQIICPGNLTLYTDLGSCESSQPIGTPLCTDNCSTPTYYNDAPSSFPVGITDVTWTATDGVNNATCIQEISVLDLQPPLIHNCPNDTIVVPDSIGCYAADVSWIEPTFSDNCTGGMLTGSFSPGTSFPHGISNVSYTAVDNSGNSSTCSFDIHVMDDLSLTTSVFHENSPSNGSIDLTVSGGISPYIFDWDIDGVGDNDDQEDLMNLVSGTYTVLVYDQIECVDTITAIILNTIHVDEFNEQLSIKIFPNPVSNKMLIINSKSFELKLITIYTLDGKKIMESKLKGYEAKVNVNYPEGLYIVEIIDSTENVMRTIIYVN